MQSSGAAGKYIASADGALENVLRPWAFRLNLAVWLERALVPVASVIVIAGVGHLLAKMLAPEFAAAALVIGVTLIPVALWGAWKWCAVRQLFFKPAEVAEHLDHFHRNDGSVTSAFERPDLVGGGGLWLDVKAVAALRSPRLRPWHYGKRVVPAFLFAGAAMFVPPRKPQITRTEFAVMEAVTQPIAERMETAKDLLPEDKKVELEKQLEEVKKAEGGVSREQWEAMEEVQKRVDEAVQHGAEAAAEAATTLNEISNMVGGSQDSTGLGLDSGQQARMENMMQNLSMKADAGKVPMSAANKKQLSELLSRCKGGKCDAKSLREACMNLAKDLEGRCKNAGEGKCFGRGGINRGRADAPYVLGEDQSMNAYSEQQQLENKYLTPEDLVDMGVIRVEPKPDPGIFKQATIKNVAGSEGSHVSRTRIGPSQREVIQKYFAK